MAKGINFLALAIILLLCFVPMLIKIPLNSNFSTATSRYPSFLREPVTSYLCENILFNITNGRWVRKIDMIKDTTSEEYQTALFKEREFDEEMARFRIDRGVHVRLWRDDLKCGYRNLQAKPKGRKWGGSSLPGSWCDARSDRPCCNDSENGVCGTMCDCAGCVDMRNILHAEFSEWIAKDPRCRIRKYTVEEVCKVIGKFREIHFFGDSFIKNMFMALVLTLRNNHVNGSVPKKYTPHLRKLCVGPAQIYWTECSLPAGSVPQTLVDDSPICDGILDDIRWWVVWKVSMADTFLGFIKRFAGKVGTLVVFDIGFHDRCNAARAWHEYVKPAITYLDNYYNTSENFDEGLSTKSIKKWPHLVFTLPDRQGLLEPTAYRNRNGGELCEKFREDMKRYCESVNLPVLDYSQLTTSIHSYDGTHHGIGANLVKVEILLNYLDSLELE